MELLVCDSLLARVLAGIFRRQSGRTISQSVEVLERAFTASSILATMELQQLAKRIAEVALLRGTFTLRSGRTSNYYLDKYLFETQPDVLRALGEHLAEHVDRMIDRVAGAELGGIPLVSATSMTCGKPSVLIRNQKKGYGTAKQIEGKLEPGDRVILVEDIVTTGGQLLEAAKVLQTSGATVTKIVAVIDRQEGGRENIEGAGFRFESLFTKTDLGID